MAGYGKFKAGIISRAEYDSEGVGYSTVMEDFPMILGPLAVYDQIDIQMKPWGRHPVSALPLFVNETNVDRWTGVVTQNGVNSASAFATPTVDTIPPACIVVVQVTASSVLGVIDAAAKHFVLGIENPDLNGDPLPGPLEEFDWDVPFMSSRWTELRNALVALGMDQDLIDTWRGNHPDATPRGFAEAFKNFIN
jgi:hypothetical protein